MSSPLKSIGFFNRLFLFLLIIFGIISVYSVFSFDPEYSGITYATLNTTPSSFTQYTTDLADIYFTLFGNLAGVVVSCFTIVNIIFFYQKVRTYFSWILWIMFWLGGIVVAIGMNSVLQALFHDQELIDSLFVPYGLTTSVLDDLMPKAGVNFVVSVLLVILGVVIMYITKLKSTVVNYYHYFTSVSFERVEKEQYERTMLKTAILHEIREKELKAQAQSSSATEVIYRTPTCSPKQLVEVLEREYILARDLCASYESIAQTHGLTLQQSESYYIVKILAKQKEQELSEYRRIIASISHWDRFKFAVAKHFKKALPKYKFYDLTAYRHCQPETVINTDATSTPVASSDIKATKLSGTDTVFTTVNTTTTTITDNTNISKVFSFNASPNPTVVTTTTQSETSSNEQMENAVNSSDSSNSSESSNSSVNTTNISTTSSNISTTSSNISTISSNISANISANVSNITSTNVSSNISSNVSPTTSSNVSTNSNTSNISTTNISSSSNITISNLTSNLTNNLTSNIVTNVTSSVVTEDSSNITSSSIPVENVTTVNKVATVENITSNILTNVTVGSHLTKDTNLTAVLPNTNLLSNLSTTTNNISITTSNTTSLNSNQFNEDPVDLHQYSPTVAIGQSAIEGSNLTYDKDFAVEPSLTNVNVNVTNLSATKVGTISNSSSPIVESQGVTSDTNVNNITDITDVVTSSNVSQSNVSQYNVSHSNVSQYNVSHSNVSLSNISQSNTSVSTSNVSINTPNISVSASNASVIASNINVLTSNVSVFNVNNSNAIDFTIPTFDNAIVPIVDDVVTSTSDNLSSNLSVNTTSHHLSENFTIPEIVTNVVTPDLVATHKVLDEVSTIVSPTNNTTNNIINNATNSTVNNTIDSVTDNTIDSTVKNFVDNTNTIVEPTTVETKGNSNKDPIVTTSINPITNHTLSNDIPEHPLTFVRANTTENHILESSVSNSISNSTIDNVVVTNTTVANITVANITVANTTDVKPNVTVVNTDNASTDNSLEDSKLTTKANHVANNVFTVKSSIQPIGMMPQVSSFKFGNGEYHFSGSASPLANTKTVTPTFIPVVDNSDATDQVTSTDESDLNATEPTVDSSIVK